MSLLDAFPGALLLGCGLFLSSAPESRDVAGNNGAWLVSWGALAVLLLVSSFRVRLGVLPGVGRSLGPPLWLVAGVAGAAVLGGHAVDVLAASGVELPLDGTGLPGLRLGSSILLAALFVPLFVAWLTGRSRSGPPPLRLLGLAALVMVLVVVVPGLLGTIRGLPKLSAPVDQGRQLWVLAGLSWALPALVLSFDRSRRIGRAAAGLMALGASLGLVVLPLVAVLVRGRRLGSLGDGGLAQILVARDLGPYGGEVAAGLEAALCASAAAALLLVCLRNAIHGWRGLPAIVGLAMPVAVVLAESRLQSDLVALVALAAGWSALLLGSPLAGQERAGENEP